MDADAGCQMQGRKHGEPASNVLFADRESFSGKPDEWIEDGAPRDLVVVERVVEMMRADWVLGQEQRAVDRIPNGKCPIADEFGKAVGAPLFVGRCDDGNVGG